MEVIVSDSWRAVHRDSRVGTLVSRHVSNPVGDAALDERRRIVEERLRARFTGKTRADLTALDTVKAYNAFYKAFNKTYHVQSQLESVVLKGKPLTSSAALIQAMFMAEIENQLLTAGHDLDAVVAPVTIAASQGGETYTRINGQAQALQPNDMFMTDAHGILSSVIYGPDQRTQITPQTRNVLFVTYAVHGIAQDALLRHLEQIEEYVRVVSPAAEREMLEVWGESKDAHRDS